MTEKPGLPQPTEDQFKLEPGDLIQVNEKVRHWWRCILVVDERKGWGVQAYCTIPGSGQERGRSGDAYMRLQWDEFEPLGVKSIWLVKDPEPDSPPTPEAS